MKWIKYSIWFAGVGISIIACKKDSFKQPPIASLNITTAIVNGGNVQLNMVTEDSINAYNAKLFTINAGVNTIKLYPTYDPASLYYDKVLQTEHGDIYSIFLGGELTSLESVVVKENLPAFYNDSSFGVRVINLSPNSNPVNVTLASDAKTNIFSGVVYKQLTDFVKLPLPLPVPAGSVNFQVRDASSGDLLATYNLPASVNSTYPNVSVAKTRFRNLTLVVKGFQGVTSGDNVFGIFPVANY